jgi:hypothetical protein
MKNGFVSDDTKRESLTGNGLRLIEYKINFVSGYVPKPRNPCSVYPEIWPGQSCYYIIKTKVRTRAIQHLTPVVKTFGQILHLENTTA